MKSVSKRKKSWDDKLFDFLSSLFLVTLVIIVFYPLYFVVIASVSAPQYVNTGTPLLYPRGFDMSGYKMVFQDQRILTGYINTIFYTVTGTFFGTFVVLLAGYALSRKDLPGRGVIMRLFVFTMYFSGGLIPLYMVVKGLDLTNTRTVLVILGSVSAYNIIVVRSFMGSTIPDELLDAAKIDGCGNGRFFAQIVMPLSKAVIAVMVLYIAVYHWNSYFNAMIYLTDKNKYPLQVYLREILLAAQSVATNTSDGATDAEVMQAMLDMVAKIKYAVIVVSTAPIICVYPFIQKYFVKGVMIGSVKG